MNVHAVLCWYDEHPRWLAATTTAAAKLADTITAIDGAYLRYPQGRPSSGGEQAETIHTTATAAGITCTIHTPATVWYGDEIHKRNHALKLALTNAEPYDDWLLIIDGDEILTYASELTRHDLKHTEHNTAEVTNYTTATNPNDWSGTSRRLFRCFPTMRYTTTHFTLEATYEDGDTILLNGRGPAYNETPEDALDLTTQIRIEHRHSLRAQHRDQAANTYAAHRHITEPWTPA